ncbi:MAG: repeat-containing protein [Pedosphaera sp.]|nr:repeat-containing protein [Pedosphaera sp.]
METMQALEPPHSFSLSAAVGWMELGNLAEATAELDGLPAALQKNPAVLDVRWAICAETKNWTGGFIIATTLMDVAPEYPYGWLHAAYALRRVENGGLQAAWNLLRPVMEKFPEHGIIPYNLACYACQLNRPAEALDLLKLAQAAGDKTMVKSMALKDPDLEPLWPQIDKL